MQIILLEKIANVGNLGDVVKVKDGYARNFLIPHGKAKRATADNIKMLEAKRAELEAAANAKLVEAQAHAAEGREGEGDRVGLALTGWVPAGGGASAVVRRKANTAASSVSTQVSAPARNAGCVCRVAMRKRVRFR